MRGDASHHVGLTDSSQLAQKRDHTLIQEVSSHQFIAILAEIVGGLAGFAIHQRLLIRRAHTFPHVNGISHIGRHRAKKYTLELIGWTANVSKLCLWFDRVALFITHFWHPLPAHTS